MAPCQNGFELAPDEGLRWLLPKKQHLENLITVDTSRLIDEPYSRVNKILNLHERNSLHL